MSEKKTNNWPRKEPRQWWVLVNHRDGKLYYSSEPNGYSPGHGWILVREVIEDLNFESPNDD